MKEIEFKEWLFARTTSRKITSDTISRLKKLERALNIDIDIEFENDCCFHLFSFFENCGRNDYSASITNCDLPIGKYYLSTYKLALKKYMEYIEMSKGSN